MAANRVLKELNAFSEFASTGFKYNLQVFPDTITAGALLFSMLFQSAPFAALSGSMILLRFLHPVLGSFLASVLNGVTGPGDAERCSGQFPGASFESLIGASTAKSFGSLSDGSWPSFYSMFIGFLIGYIGLLPFIYQGEIAASPKRQASTTTGLVVLSLVAITSLVFRFITECDTAQGILVGTIAGTGIGALLVGFLAYISDRRITNILGFPLIRSRSEDGKPIYVCERPEK